MADAPPPVDPRVANTPIWTDKAFYLAILGFLLPILNQKFGWDLDPVAIASACAAVVAFIVGNKWKTGKVVVEQIKAQTAAHIVASSPTDSQAAAKALEALYPPHK